MRMSSMDRLRNHIAQREQESIVPLPLSEAVSQDAEVEQLPFPDAGEMAQISVDVPQYDFPAVSFPSQLLANSTTTVRDTDCSIYAVVLVQDHTLRGGQTGAFPAQHMHTSQRLPVVIPGSRKKDSGTGSATKPRRKRLATHLVVSVLLVFVLTGALMAVLPTSVDGQATNPFQSLFMQAVNSRGNNTASIASLVATATAVTQDGFDNGGTHHYAYVASAPTAAPTSAVSSAAITSAGSSSAADSGSLARFAYGQCTYWANMRYHQLTGHWVPWLGNADQWAAGAAADGWVVSGKPNPSGPSIIVLQPYVQGAGAYGHVAVVERVNANGSVYTSNWNWAGNWGATTYVTFTPASGVSFVWY